MVIIVKIFLDDIRTPKSPDWYICRTAEEAIFLIKNSKCDEISFDHDLGDENDLTGYTVAKCIEKLAATGELKKFPVWYVHSANPVGKKNIVLAMKSAFKLYKRRNND